MVSQELVVQKILAFLNGEMSERDLVHRAEDAWVELSEGDLDVPNEEAVSETLMYVGAGDQPGFPLTWSALSSLPKAPGCNSASERRGSLTELRFAVFGAGFWAQYQLAGWRELEGARCVAIYNRTPAKAEALARRFGVPAVYADAEELLRRERPDFVDVITSVETHAPLVHLAARHGVPVICQKPMATTLPEAEGMVAACREAGVSFFVHENWRWQTPIRALRRALDSGAIGRPFRARLDFVYSFPVFDNQPFLKELDQFILTDMGSHILDVARFLFGEASSLYCQAQRIHGDIRGEDVVTVVMRMGSATVVCNLSYASPREDERYPQTYAFVEGEKGSAELGPDYCLRVTTAAGTEASRHAPPSYAWANPLYDVVHASIVACNANILSALRGEGQAETTGADNLRTVRLVFASYDSTARDEVVHSG